jgi:ABC-type transport system involved in multi-copper enzyme maturation permease subunit
MMRMFRAVLGTQWKWSRLIVVVGTVAGFAIPLLSVQGAARGRGALQTPELLHAVQSWGSVYPLLAAALGLLLAIAAWAADHRGRHIHALTLPLPRWRYVLLRFAAGVVLLVVPIFAVFAGASLAVLFATIPEGLQVYPLALTLRFALAVLVAFAVFFAISAGTARTAGIVLAAIAAVILVQVVANIANLDLDLVSTVQLVLVQGVGPLAVFTGRWMLIDV